MNSCSPLSFHPLLNLTWSFSTGASFVLAEVIPRPLTQVIPKTVTGHVKEKAYFRRLAAIEPAGGKGRNHRIPTLC